MTRKHETRLPKSEIQNHSPLTTHYPPLTTHYSPLTTHQENPMHEEARSLELPTAPCPHCGAKEFICWAHATDNERFAITCDGCGAVMSSTHPLDAEDRPRRRP
jgi:hypothetical protein